jgi:hypothetical protein
LQPEALTRGSYRDDYSKWGEPSVWFRIMIHLDLTLPVHVRASAAR